MNAKFTCFWLVVLLAVVPALVGNDCDPPPPSPGYVPGSYAVNSDGAATYEIPIEVPIGRNGVQPSLSLVYNSRSGDGVLGLGWDLSGLSVITRCARTVAVDGLAASIEWTNDDEFCLDGKPFRSVTGPKGPGTIYALVDNGRDTIRQVGAGPTRSFTITKRDGTTYEYAPVFGGTRGDLNAIPATVSYAWPLSVVRDGYGNELRFSYTVGSAPGGTFIRPEKIEYGGNNGSPSTREVTFDYQSRVVPYDTYVSGYASTVNKVLRSITVSAAGEEVREYSLKYDDSAPAEYGSGTRGPPRLSEVGMCARGECLHPITVDWYSDPIATRERDVLPPGSFFAASAGPLPLVRNVNFIEGPVVGADTNGDGADELIWLERDQTTNEAVEWRRLYFTGWNQPGESIARFTTSLGLPVAANLRISVVDHDGDGLESLSISPGPDRYELFSPTTSPGVYLVNGVARAYHLLEEELDIPDACDPAVSISIWGGIWRPFPLTKIDEDGDGLSEVLGLCRESTNVVLAYTRSWNGTTFSAPNDIFRNAVDTYPTPLRGVVDFDDDGVDEYSVSDDLDRFIVRNDTPTGFSLDALGTGPDGFFADVNGDGLKDLIQTLPNGAEIRLNSGNGFLAPYPALAAGAAGDWADEYEFASAADVRVADFNGDNKDDFLLLFSESWRADAVLHFSDGHVFYTMLLEDFSCHVGIDNTFFFPEQFCGTEDVKAEGEASAGGELPPEISVSSSLVQVIDLDGDGWPEVTRWPFQDPIPPIGDLPLELSVMSFWSPNRDLVRKINDGKQQPEFEYSDASNREVHQPSTECQHPQKCLTGGLPLVSKLIETRAEDFQDPVETTYMCNNGRFDVSGIGWIGFEEVESTTTASDALLGTTVQTKVRRRFDNHVASAQGTYPFRGLPTLNVVERQGTGTGDDRIYSNQETITYSIHNLPSGGRTVVEGVRGQSSLVECSSCGPDGLVTGISLSSHQYDSQGSLIGRTQLAGGDSTQLTIEREDRPLDSIVGLPVRIDISHTVGGQTETRTTEYEYDSAGGLERVAVQPGDTDQAVRLDVMLQRNSLGLVDSIVNQDGLGNVRSATFTYDQDNIHVETVQDAGGNLRTFSTDSGLGLVTEVIDPAGVATQVEYDPFGRPTKKSVNGADQWALQYSGTSQITRSLIDLTSTGSPIMREDVIDSLGRLATTYFRGPDGQWRETSTVYSPDGVAIGVSRPEFKGDLLLGSTQWAYFERDALGRLTTFWAASASGAPSEITTYAYSDDGRTTTITRPNDAEIVQLQDERGRLVESRDLFTGISLGTSYEPFDTMARVEDDLGNAQAFMYDRLGRLTATTDPDRGNFTLAYNGHGDLVDESGPGSNQITYSYDNVGRLESVQADTQTQFTYSLGRLDSAVTSTSVPGLSSSQGFTYDSRGRLQTQTLDVDGVDQFLTEYSYDQADRLTNVSYEHVGAQALDIDYAYGTSLQPETISDGTTQEVYFSLVEADEAGRPIRFDVPGATIDRTFNLDNDRQTEVRLTKSGDSSPSFIEGYFYEANGRLNSKSRQFTGSAPFEVYEYDSLSRPEKLIVGNLVATETVNYAYDTLGRLTENADTAQTYDGTGNAGPHAVTSSGASIFSYDASGRRIGQSGPQPYETIEYSASDLPTRFLGAGGAVLAENRYDSFGDLLRETNPGAGSSTTFVSEQFEHHQTPSHGFSLHRIPAYGMEVARVQIDSASGARNTASLVEDQAGSIVATLDLASDQLTAFRYGPFGSLFDEQLNKLDPTGYGPLFAPKFAGHSYTSQGFVDMGGRVYDPRAGQFLTPDPVFTAGPDVQSVNPYAYVLNQPTRFVDPTGFTPETPGEDGSDPGDGGGQGGGPGAAFLRPVPPVTPPGAIGNAGDAAGIPFDVGAGSQSTDRVLDRLQLGLDAAAIAADVTGVGVPVGILLDLSNAAISGLRGDRVGAGIALFAAIPFIGNTAALLKASRRTLRFTQTTASAVFKHGRFAGKTIGEVADLLRRGKIKPSELPIDVVVRNGETLALNTRSLLALKRGGIDPSKFVINDRTGDAFFENILTKRLRKNELTEAGTEVLRITGAGNGVSSLR